MNGQNEVYLTGFLKFPQLRQTKNGHTQFQGKVAVPGSYTDRVSGETKDTTRYVKVSAWGELAEELGSLPEGTALKVQGTFNDRSYEGNCKDCGTVQTKYWTDVQIANFEVIQDA
jgi:single-stranded DNA-binding protein